MSKIATNSWIETNIFNGYNLIGSQCPTKKVILDNSQNLITIPSTYKNDQLVKEEDLLVGSNSKKITIYCENGINGRLYIDNIYISICDSAGNSIVDQTNWYVNEVANNSSESTDVNLTAVGNDKYLRIWCGTLGGKRNWYYKDDWRTTSYKKIVSDSTTCTWIPGWKYNQWLANVSKIYIKVQNN